MPRKRFASYNKPQTRVLKFDGYEVKPYDRYSWGTGWYYEERKYDNHGERIFRYNGPMGGSRGNHMLLHMVFQNKVNKPSCWVLRNVPTEVTIHETIYTNPMKPPLAWAMQMLDIMGTGD